VDGLRSLGLSAGGLLEEMALLLQQMAVQQAVPGALDEDDPDTEAARELSAALAADETQLLYSMVVHGREELGLLSDEYGALTMVLLRFLAFPGGGGVTAAAPPPPRAAPLRAPAPPAITLPAPAPAPAAAVAPPAPRVAEPAAPTFAAPLDRGLGDRWHALVTRMSEAGSISALARELATQGGLRSIDQTASPPRWLLVVERETLRSPALRDKLAAALAAQLGQPLQLELEPGTPEDTPARRDAAERQRRQAAAEAAIQGDAVVKELLSQFKTARIVPGSIKPLEGKGSTP
jgi:DNA polymerase III subunit gamma/tau